MAILDKQMEKWMTMASFNALDKSTIPEGTEINIVGDIEESDLSLGLREKINPLHLYRCEITATVASETMNIFFNLYAREEITTIETLSKYLVIDFKTQFPIYGYGVSYLPVGSVGITSISGTSLSDMSIHCWGTLVCFPYLFIGETHVFTDVQGKLELTQIW